MNVGLLNQGPSIGFHFAVCNFLQTPLDQQLSRLYLKRKSQNYLAFGRNVPHTLFRLPRAISCYILCNTALQDSVMEPKWAEAGSLWHVLIPSYQGHKAGCRSDSLGIHNITGCSQIHRSPP